MRKITIVRKITIAVIIIIITSYIITISSNYIELPGSSFLDFSTHLIVESCLVLVPLGRFITWSKLAT